jgi:hypothetical protein
MPACNFEKHCITLPFPSECANFCIFGILSNITVEHKINILGLTQETAETIFRAFNLFHVESYEDLQGRLSSIQISELQNAFSQLTKEKLDQLNNLQ